MPYYIRLKSDETTPLNPIAEPIDFGITETHNALVSAARRRGSYCCLSCLSQTPDYERARNAYLLNPQTESVEPCWYTRASANEVMQTTYNPREYKIVYLATDQETAAWKEREQQRFAFGPYLHVPWRETAEARGAFLTDHYAHLSIKQPGMIAYTKSADHGFDDRQTVIAPGRYLQEYYRDTFDTREREAWTAKCQAALISYSITRDESEIRQVYENGPDSCMKNSRFDHWDHHPTAAYANSPDLAVAYFGPIERPAARTVVWPDKKIYVRLYGNVGVLEQLLIADGYTHDNINGARLTINRNRHGSLIIPYVDGGDTGYLYNGYIHVNQVVGKSRREYGNVPQCSLSETSGYDEDCDQDEDENETFTCEACDRETEGDCDQYGGVCYSCYRQRFDCAECDETFYNRNACNFVENVGRVCEDCHSSMQCECAVTGCNETWIERARTYTTIAARVRLNQTNLCDAHAEDLRQCAACSEPFDVTLSCCSHCAATVRCSDTGDLLSADNLNPFECEVESYVAF